MATILEDINDAIETIMASTLGVDYSELKYKYTIEQNNFITNKKRYASIPLDGNSEGGITKHMTVLHDFEINLVDSYINKDNSDVAKQNVVFILDDKMNDVLNELYIQKLGLPAIVMNVNNFRFSAPEFLGKDNVCVLKTIIAVLYRQTVN